MPTSGRPLNFLDVPVPAHLAFYRAGIAAITDEDPYAGLLVSMHGAGIYRQRYGAQPELKLSRAGEVADLVEEFVAEQEASYPSGATRSASPRRSAGPTTTACRSTTGSRSSSASRISRPVRATTSAGIDSRRSGPGRRPHGPLPVHVSETAHFTLLRRLLPKRQRTFAELRHELLDTPAERLEIRVEPALARPAGARSARAQGARVGALGLLSRRRETAVEGLIGVNGVSLWHRITGEGEPVVQIHGAGFGHFNFDPATPELSKQFRVVDYDMRGYGQSDKPLQHYDMEVWADDLAGLMDALGIEQAHVHGTSMGGMIAIVFAGKYPERTTSVVINCAAAQARASPAASSSRTGSTSRRSIRRAREPPARRADHLAGAVEGVPRGAGRRARSIDYDPDDPARLEPTRGVHRRLPGDVRHGHHGLAAADHLAGARARRRRGPDDAVGSGPRRCRPGGRSTEGSPAPRSTSSRGSSHSTIFDNTEEHNRVVVDFFRRSSREPARASRRAGVAGRAGHRGATASSRSRPSSARPAGATCSRSTSRSSSIRSCTCSGPSRSSPAGCRSGGPWPRWSSGRRSPSRCSRWSRSPASTTGSRARSRCARTWAAGERACSRRRTGSSRRPTGSRRRRSTAGLGAQAIYEAMTGRPTAARAARARLRSRPRDARRARLRRDAVAPARRAAGVGRLHAVSSSPSTCRPTIRGTR